MTALISLLGTLGVFAFIALFSWIFFKIVDFIDNKIEAKRRKEHPIFFTLTEAINAKGTEYCNIYNAEVATRRNRIDAILRDLDYVSSTTRQEKENELEELRLGIEAITPTIKMIMSEKDELRKQIHSYVEEHNLKWAKRWGW